MYALLSILFLLLLWRELMHGPGFLSENPHTSEG